MQMENYTALLVIWLNLHHSISICLSDWESSHQTSISDCLFKAAQTCQFHQQRDGWVSHNYIFFTRNKECVLPLYFCTSLCLWIQTASFYMLWYKIKTFLFFHRHNKERRAVTKIISILEVEIHRRAAQPPFLIWRCFHLQSQLKREHS